MSDDNINENFETIVSSISNSLKANFGTDDMSEAAEKITYSNILPTAGDAALGELAMSGPDGARKAIKALEEEDSPFDNYDDYEESDDVVEELEDGFGQYIVQNMRDEHSYSPGDVNYDDIIVGRDDDDDDDPVTPNWLL